MKTLTLGLLLAMCLSACSRKTEDAEAFTSRDFSMAPSDVVSSSIETFPDTEGAPPPRGMTVLHIEFSRAKAQEFRRFTKDHVGQKVQILVGTNVVSSPVIQSEIVSAKLDLPFPTTAEALAISKLLGKN